MISDSILCLIGNGPGDFPPSGASHLHVTFNQVRPVPVPEGEVRVLNRTIAGRASGGGLFKVSGSPSSSAWRGVLQRVLSEAAGELKAALGCLPSTGFATTWALVRMGFSLHLYRMPLRPSLLRPTELSERKPLPAAFHNWLGERRMAWQYLHGSTAILSWPQLSFSTVDAGDSHEPLMEDPLGALAQWFETQAGEPVRRDTDGLKTLASLPDGAWLQSPDAAVLKSLEQFFFLKRETRQTPNWWLYSNELSPVIDTLLLRLMQAQQRLHLSPVASGIMSPESLAAQP